MGAKNSTSKKLEGSTRKDPTLSPSRDESLDENRRIDNNENNGDIPGIDSRKENNSQPAAGYDDNQQPRVDVNPQQRVETNQPTIQKTIQPKRGGAGNQYEEIPDEHLASNRKDKAAPQQDSARNSQAASNHTATTEASRGPQGRAHDYVEISDEQLIENRNTKKAGEKDNKKANDKLKEKDDKKKKKKEKTAQKEVFETSRSDALSGVSAENVNHKPNARDHPHDEITKEMVEATKQKIKKKDKEDKKKVKEDKKKKNKAMMESSSAKVVDVVVISANKESPKLERYHPYDEITDDHIKAQQEAKNRQKENLKKKKAKDQQVVVEDSEHVEYQNVAVIRASNDQLSRGGDGGGCGGYFSSDRESEEKTDIADTYATPQKKPLKVNIPNQLNYIQVEFNPATSKPEVKEQYSPTTYTSVINENGKFVLLNS